MFRLSLDGAMAVWKSDQSQSETDHSQSVIKFRFVKAWWYAIPPDVCFDPTTLIYNTRREGDCP